MLDYALLLEPVNMFLYTWRFLSTLERDEKHKTVKLIYRWFARITIFAVPLAFFSVYACYCIFYGKVIESYEQDNKAELERNSNIVIGLSAAIGYLTTATNLTSCFLLFLVIRFAKKLTKTVENSSIQSQAKRESKLNLIVTVIHIFVLLGFTVVSILLFNVTLTDGT